MAIKNTKLGGTDWTAGEQLKAVDLNDTINAAVNIVDSDQTGGTIDNSTTETNIGEVVLSGGTAIGGVLIIASGYFSNNQTNSRSGTIKLYSGTNSSFGSNTERKSIVMYADEVTSTANTFSWTIVYALSSEETWSNDVYLQITGKNSHAENGVKCVCESLVVIPIGGTV